MISSQFHRAATKVAFLEIFLDTFDNQFKQSTATKAIACLIEGQEGFRSDFIGPVTRGCLNVHLFVA